MYVVRSNKRSFELFYIINIKMPLKSSRESFRYRRHRREIIPGLPNYVFWILLAIVILALSGIGAGIGIIRQLNKP